MDEDSSRFIKHCWVITAVCMNTAFTQGYNVCTVFSTEFVIEEWAHEVSDFINQLPTMYTFGTLVSTSFMFGVLLGSPLVKYFGNVLGRKGGLLMSGIAASFGSLFAGYSKYFSSPMFLLIGRVLIGFHCGISLALGPLFLMEACSRNYRGIFLAIYTILYDVGESFNQIMVIYLETERYWPLVFSANIIPTMIEYTLLPSLPESPSFLFVIKKHILPSHKSAHWYRGHGFTPEELEELTFELRQRKNLGIPPMKTLFSNFILNRALMISTVLICSPILCGNRMIIYQMMWEIEGSDAGYKLGIFYWFIKPLLCFANVLLIDLVSRRTALIASFSAMSVICAIGYIINLTIDKFFLVGLYQELIFYLVIAYTVAYKLGPGCLSFFITKEYFNTSMAPIAYSVGLTVSAFLSVLESMNIDVIIFFLRNYFFLNYALTNFLLFVFCYKFVFDTRRMPIRVAYETINASMKPKQNKHSVKKRMHSK